MVRKIVYISDVRYPNYIGGGEINDYELLSLLESKGIIVEKKLSSEITIDFIKKNKNIPFIISNFILLHKRYKKDLQNSNIRYVIYEHDHKYLADRNPAFYSNFLAPKEKIINYDFYKNALAVFCQSSFHVSIVQKNTNLRNIINLGGNVWSDETLNKIEELSKNEKSETCSIMQSMEWHKNTEDAIKYCMYKNYNYSLIPSMKYENFLEEISKNKTFVFFPKTPESLSRVVVEAKMMGVKVITNNLVGATSEQWFKKTGVELIQEMRNKKNTIAELVIKKLEGKI